MDFDIEDYKRRTGRLVWDDLDFSEFATNPLDDDVLRCLRYMHDIEYHTVCYLRDLLLTPAHGDPDVTAFLGFWNVEEFWHGEGLAAVLAAHGETAGASRVESLRRRLGWRDKLKPITTAVGAAITGQNYLAVHMTWGAINEWTAQAAYGQLGRRAGSPVLSELMKRLMRQEGRHVDFYASQAAARLERSATTQKLVRGALRAFWRPVGAGVLPAEETNHMVRFLFDGDDGSEVVDRIDRRLDRLPGLAGMELVRRALHQHQSAGDRRREPAYAGTVLAA
jgi:hypothetical protein